jgi:predicted cobalt transporter CbtA
MSLLAYAIRRTLGALIVLFVVLWLIYFGVVHAMSPVSHGEPAPDYFLQFWQLVHQWTVAALQLGLGVAVLLGLGGAWRLRKQRTT